MLLEKCDASFFLSSLTTNTLMSGYRDPKSGKDPSLLPKLDGRVLAVKDISPILQDRSTRDTIFSQLRDAYDGSAAKATGMTGVTEYESAFNGIFLATPIIDAYHSMHQQLGERFLSVRFNPRVDHKAPLMAVRNTLLGRDGTLDTIKNRVQRFVTTLSVPRLSAIPLTAKIKEWTVNLSSFVCSLRTHVPRERDGVTVAALPQPEVATRLSTQLITYAAAIMVIMGKVNVDDDIRRALVWVARGSVSAVRIYVLFCLWKLQIGLIELDEEPWIPLRMLQDETRLGYRTVNQVLTDFHLMRIVDRRLKGTGRRGARYCIEPEIMDFIEDVGFFDGFETEYEVTDVVSYSHAREKNR
jgi:hypothetical protein